MVAALTQHKQPFSSYTPVESGNTDGDDCDTRLAESHNKGYRPQITNPPGTKMHR